MLKLPARVLWTSLQTEISQDRSVLNLLDGAVQPPPATVLDTPAYRSHPRVKEALRSGKRRPLPLSFYCDGVAFIQSASGRNESVCGYWLENIVTKKRHFITSVKSADACQCGCRGWCTTRPILSNVCWQLENIQEGKVPLECEDGSVFKPKDQTGRANQIMTPLGRCGFRSSGAPGNV